MVTESVKTNIFGHVLEVTLDRPKANAIDLKTSKVMGDIFCEFRDNANLRVAIITGAGEKFFCAGWDLKAAADGDAVDGDYGIGGFGGLQELPHMNKPIIAAVNGICCGGGLELALSADIILGTWSSNATLNRGFNANARAGLKDTSRPSFPTKYSRLEIHSPD